MKAKAAVLYEKGENNQLRLETVTVREPREKEVIVRMKSSGICGTEIAYQYDHWGIDYKMPVVLGHEGAGIVEKVGSAVTKVKVGDHVSIGPPCCGECFYCRQNMTWLCEGSMDYRYLSGGYDFYGTAPMTNEKGEDVFQLFEQGSLSEYTCIYEPMLTVIPKDVDISLCGPLSCGMRTGAGAVYAELKPSPGQWIVITGAGAVGLSAMWMANAMGAKTLILDVIDSRLDFAKELGATAVLNSAGMGEEEITKSIRKIVGEKGADGAVEGVGLSHVIKGIMRALKWGAHCAQVAVGTNVSFGSYMIDCNDSRHVDFVRYGNVNNDEIIPMLIDLYKEGKFPFDKLYTFYDLDNVVDALDDAKHNRSKKVVVLMNQNK
ncbi:alcohol dehydrogenase catalytic domain-containing protein [Fusibacter paucivorans]|uniref:Alcohol dehydrogenase catalytic domain-containing protein n=1 Tax=Fusibacter paucivorans TaxID=76009 RepID=A0ABS5PRZ1_9FIRM|nr:alcohol dehydrogenase catalytic domain-containing protein [Fusibacter paucivorans]MBS7527935.1 alcohol dehydrogenase catalytic domain-containing protein [Fusibacter paucivorans]